MKREKYYYRIPSSTHCIVSVFAHDEDEAWEKLCDEEFHVVTNEDPEYDFVMAERIFDDYECGWWDE